MAGIPASGSQRLPAQDYLPERAQGARFRATTTRPPGYLAAEALAVGNASGSGQGRASTGLPARIHLPLQPAQIAESRQTILPPCPAIRGIGTNNLQGNCRLCASSRIRQPQPLGAKIVIASYIQ